MTNKPEFLYTHTSKKRVLINFLSTQPVTGGDCLPATLPIPHRIRARGEHNGASLIIEDHNGIKPEGVQLTDPQKLECGVGVLYVDDLAFGASFVTIEGFTDVVLLYQYTNKVFLAGEFWEFGNVVWPGGIVTAVDIIHPGIY